MNCYNKASSNTKKSLLCSAGAQSKQVASSGLILALSLVLAFGLLVFTPAECQEQLTMESRGQAKEAGANLDDTIKYLERLDNYISQIARPRFGRSDYKQSWALGRPLQAARATLPRLASLASAQRLLEPAELY